MENKVFVCSQLLNHQLSFPLFHELISRWYPMAFDGAFTQWRELKIRGVVESAKYEPVPDPNRETSLIRRLSASARGSLHLRLGGEEGFGFKYRNNNIQGAE